MDSLTASDSLKGDKSSPYTPLTATLGESVRSQLIHPLLDATVTATTLTIPGIDEYCFLFKLADGAAVDLAQLGTGEVVVTGPHGYHQPAIFVAIEVGAIRYRVKAPNETWSQTDNGVYQIAVVVDEATPPIVVRVFQIDIADGLGHCLLQNSDFAIGLTYWATFAGTERVTRTGAYRGQTSLLLSSAESGTRQNVRVTPGGIYQLTGYGRSTAPAYSSFGMVFLDDQGSLLSRSDVGTISSSQWQDYFVVALAPTRAAYVQVWAYQDFDHGMTQIDGLSLRQIDPDDMPPTQVSQFILINGPLAPTDRTFACEC
ncbi:MAG: hypothetical protein AAGI69_16915 [Cyanobacteria bacterium P01_H01_bin.21]